MVRETEARRILLIDDDDAIRELTSEVLSDEGYVVETADSIPAAHALLGQASYDLILSDTISSEMGNSWLWLEQLRQSTSVSILIFSAHDASRFNHWQERGYAGVLTKPFELDHLLALVADLLKP